MTSRFWPIVAALVLWAYAYMTARVVALIDPLWILP